MKLDKYKLLRLFIYRRGSGIIPGMVNAYGSYFKILDIQPNSGLKIWYNVKRSEIRALDKPSQRCDASNNGISVSKCVGRFVEGKLNNCSLKLLMSNPHLESCHQPIPEQHLDTITNLNKMDEREIFEQTGCVPGCSKSEFGLLTLQELQIMGKKLELTLSFMQGEYDLIEEYYIYDYTSFIADVGGYLGLLLGYSLLSMYHTFVRWAYNHKISNKR